MRAIDQIIEALARQPGFDFANFDPDRFVAELDAEAIEHLIADIIADEERAMFSKFDDLFPDEGPYRRELYPKHIEFFGAGKQYRERCFLAANRVGKTVAGGFEVSAHLTGRYPTWWPGRQFRHPTRIWAAGDTLQTTRDIQQLELLGNVTWDAEGNKTVDGAGLIPRDAIGRVTWKPGSVPDCVDTVQIKHKTGRYSSLGFKSYDQGRRTFQGTSKEVIWLDEECPMDVYGECLIRTGTTRGLIMSTFTPLKGLTDVVLSFLGDDLRPS